MTTTPKSPSTSRDKLKGTGESQGGAYPNPHGRKPDEEREDGPMGHGGQSEMAYHGTGRLGEDEVEGARNPNAPARDD